jgi:LmbE family N-acetylglucosaminyl deacetylase
MKTLVVAPHADDELLGCGGTLLRRRAAGGVVGWLLVTSMNADRAWGTEKIEQRQREIVQVRDGLGVLPEHLYELGLQTTQLDQVPTGVLVGRISEVFEKFRPEEVLVPHAHDIHSDHRIVFDAVAACTKWFRYPSVKRVMAYETISETDFILKSEGVFNPTFFVDITDFIDRKIALMGIYRSELGVHPFPRSESGLRALATLRGAQSGFGSAEAFQLLRERG